MVAVQSFFDDDQVWEVQSDYESLKPSYAAARAEPVAAAAPRLDVVVRTSLSPNAVQAVHASHQSQQQLPHAQQIRGPSQRQPTLVRSTCTEMTVLLPMVLSPALAFI